MSFFGRLLGGSTSPSNSEAIETDTNLTCDCCGCAIDEDEMDEGQCEDCYSDYSGPKYCCGTIYEDGEITCRSCGDPL